MNKQRRAEIEIVRKQFEVAQEMIDAAKEALEALRDEEQDYYDNMPESLQGGEKGDVAQSAIDALTSAYDEVENFDFDSIYSQLDEATT